MSIPNLNSIYTKDFFAQWGRANPDYVSSAELITDVLYDNFKPRRLADIGCGCGVYAHFFRKQGVEVFCVDGVSAPARYAFEVPAQIQDLTEPFENRWGRFDLVLCLDVGEHIPEPVCDFFLSNLTQFGDILLLSCAPPGQGGHHHVNEQPKRYWIKRLSSHGFTYNRRATGRLCETFKCRRPVYMWMWEQISLYERR